MNKRLMYNRIMESVAKQVKKALLEDSYKLDPNTMSSTHNVKSPNNTVKNVVKQELSINPEKEMKKIMEKDRLSKEDIEKCINLYKKYKVLYKTDLDKKEFKEFIISIIKLCGNLVNLNWINTSNVTNMSNLFYHKSFNGDISKWDVSRVTNMSFMFSNSSFNGDLSRWDVSKVVDMTCMFYYSEFNGDLSFWNVSNVNYMRYMFAETCFNQDISKWDVDNVIDMTGIFENSDFSGDLSHWRLYNNVRISQMFLNNKNYDVQKLTKMFPKLTSKEINLMLN